MAELKAVAQAYRHDPWDIDVEQRLLGAVMRDNDNLDRISIAGGDLYDPLHARIFAQMAVTIAAGERATPVSLHATLKSDPGMIEAGGLAYLEAMQAAAPAIPADVAGHARILRDLAQRRALLQLGQRMAEESLLPPGEATTAALIAGFEAGLRETADRGPDALPLVCAARLDGAPIPPREEVVEGLVPKGTVTLLGGDGGTGKSLLAQQILVCGQTEATFFGRIVEDGPAIYVSAEDDENELHRRLAAIAAYHDVPLTKLAGLHLVPLAGRDALLAIAAPDGTIEPTPLFRALEQKIRAIQPVLVVLDTLADLFGGNENDRVHARQFIGLLRGLAMRHGATILLLAHPSLSGMSSGAGTSGSTAWNNSVRSRLTLERVKGGGDSEDDPDVRVLKVKKSNYGPAGTEIRMRWERGVFRPIGEGKPASVAAVEQKADRTFLEMLAAYVAQGRRVSAIPGTTFAPAIFAVDGAAGGVTKKALADAMNRLLASGAIRIEETGPASKRRSRLVLGDSQ